MPDPFMFDTAHRFHGIRDKLEDPVKIVRSPIVEDAARDWFVGVPVIAGVRIATDECLHMEDRANGTSLHDPLDGEIVGVPPTALVHRERAPPLFRKLNHGISFGRGEAEWLLRD